MPNPRIIPLQPRERLIIIEKGQLKRRLEVAKGKTHPNFLLLPQYYACPQFEKNC